MINFCKSSIHSILGIPNSDDRRSPAHRPAHIFPPPNHGGLLRLLATDSPKPPHIIESPAVGPCERPPDPGAWGLHEAAGPSGGLDRCTESLGSESCDSGIEIGDDNEESAAEIAGKRDARRRFWRRKAEVRFPPPLRWMLGRGGRRSRFLRAERRDGRFVLTEFRIDHPPEVLRAVRGGGRLRLELVEAEGGGEEELEGRDERWEMLRVRNEGLRCVEEVNGGDGDGTATPLWCNNQCFATTA